VKQENDKLNEWYDDNIVDDIEDNEEIARLAYRRCLDAWNVGLGENADDTKTSIAFYGIVYDSIMEALREKRVKHKEYAINFAEVVIIGYDDSEDDGEQEKVGNFCPYIYSGDAKTEPNQDPDLKSIERCVEWKAKNLVNAENTKIISEIETLALKKLVEEADIHLSNPEPIFALFTTIHEQMVAYMKIKQAESGEDEMINFAGRFDVYCRPAEDGEIVIEYSPTPSEKLGIKADHIATATNE